MGRSEAVLKALFAVFLIVWIAIGAALITSVIYLAASDDPILPTPPTYSDFDPDGAGYPDPYST